MRKLNKSQGFHKEILSLLSLSLKWCLAHPYVDSQLEQNIEALHGEGLGEELKQQCDEIGKDLMKHRISYFK